MKHNAIRTVFLYTILLLSTNIYAAGGDIGDCTPEAARTIKPINWPNRTVVGCTIRMNDGVKVDPGTLTRFLTGPRALGMLENVAANLANDSPEKSNAIKIIADLYKKHTDVFIGEIETESARIPNNHWCPAKRGTTAATATFNNGCMLGLFQLKANYFDQGTFLRQGCDDVDERKFLNGDAEEQIHAWACYHLGWMNNKKTRSNVVRYLAPRDNPDYTKDHERYNACLFLSMMQFCPGVMRPSYRDRGGKGISAAEHARMSCKLKKIPDDVPLSLAEVRDRATGPCPCNCTQ